jgi:hypothetical protein
MTSSASGNTEKKGGMPVWAKVLIAVFVVGTVLVVGGLVCLFVFVSNIQKQAKDPAYIAKVRESIADMTLPANFSDTAGFDLVGSKIVCVTHKPDNLELTLTKLPAASENKTAAQITDQFASRGMPMAGGSAPIEVSSKGTETVGGEQMPYVLGTSTNKTGTKCQTMLGAVITKDKNLVVFYALTPGDKYDMDATKEFLGSIKSFR